MTKKLFFIFIAVELLTIAFLGVNLYRKTSKVLSASVVSLPKDSFIFQQDSSFKYFYEPKPSLTSHNKPPWLSYASTNTINSDTIHDRYDYQITKPEKTFRMVNLGDSFAFGLYVDTKDNYSEKLEDLLNSSLFCANIQKFEVINLGVPGYDIAYSIERFKRRGVKYDPDLVMLFLTDRNFVVQWETFNRKYYENYKQELLGDLIPFWDVKIASQLPLEIQKEYGVESIVQYQSDALESVKNYYADSILIFSSPGLLSKSNQEIIKKFGQSRPNIYFTDSIGNSKNIENIVAEGDTHPSQKGHSLITQDLLTYLTQNKIIPCD